MESSYENIQYVDIPNKTPIDQNALYLP